MTYIEVYEKTIKDYTVTLSEDEFKAIHAALGKAPTELTTSGFSNITYLLYVAFDEQLNPTD